MASPSPAREQLLGDVEEWLRQYQTCETSGAGRCYTAYLLATTLLKRTVALLAAVPEPSAPAEPQGIIIMEHCVSDAGHEALEAEIEEYADRVFDQPTPTEPIVATADPWDAGKVPYEVFGKLRRPGNLTDPQAVYLADWIDKAIQARALAAAQHQQEVETLRRELNHEAYRGDKAREERNVAEGALVTAVARLQQLERALVEVMIPLEALHASVQWELAAALKAQIAQSVTAGRGALSTTREP